MNQLEREEQWLQESFERGELTRDEFNREMMDLQRAYREAARDRARDRDYDEEWDR